MHRLIPALTVGLALAATGGVADADVRGTADQGANIQPDVGLQLDSDATRRVFFDLATTGANRVTFNIPLFQNGIDATVITARPEGRGTAGTPTDAQLVKAIRNARLAGLRVVLKPHLELPGGEWRAHIIGSDAWQAAWNAWLLHYARIAQAEKVDTFVIGTEQRGTTMAKYSRGNPARWIKTVALVRREFHGTVTYGAHMRTEARELSPKFVHKLDYMGVTYYPFPDRPDETVARLRREMQDDRRPYFDKVHSLYGKDVLVLETGFRSVAYADKHAKDLAKAKIDTHLQAMEWQALLSYLDGIPYVKGVHAYRIFNRHDAGGPADKGFTWQGKPAEAVVANWFGGQVPARSIHEWWPTEDAQLSGRSSVKAVLVGAESRTYTMRYRVDKGAWKGMRTVDGHKEAALVVSRPGTHYVQTQALDRAGHVIADTVREVRK